MQPEIISTSLLVLEITLVVNMEMDGKITIMMLGFLLLRE